MRRDQLNALLSAELRVHLAGQRPKIPEAGRLLWSWFVELAASRTYHMAGPHAISYAEIDAWARLRGIPLQRHHIDTLRALDDVWLEHAYADKRAARSGVKTLPRRSDRAMTAGLFDAMFG
jgi:hypothetical protein